MKRLIVVSNRLPYQVQESEGKVTLRQSDGGLVTALKSYFEEEARKGGAVEKRWVGAADFPEKRWKKFKAQENTETTFEIDPIFIEKRTYSKFYNGFCNATLWPLFHYFPSYVEYDDETFQAYEAVNRAFADMLLTFLQPGDTLWIHDYQLLLLPDMIRQKLPDISIGFFLHIPFPSYEIFRLLHRTWKEKIIRGMLGADLVGFHTHEYVQHFLKTVRMVAGYDHQFRSIVVDNRIIKADLFPLGIDYAKFHDAANVPAVIEQRDTIRKNFQDKKIIFSVDRLDYTKGVTHRLVGFEKFLEAYPEWKEQVVFVLVVVPSRQIISKYNERLKLIEEQVGSINGKHSTLSWQPIIYRYSNLAFDELCALYEAADAALITPLRDGMNLVAKEYVASRAQEDGVLILSELAGAANEMGEALLVNPVDTADMANAISTALTMPIQEQRRNMKLLQKRLKEYTVIHWVNDFLKQLDDVRVQQHEQETKAVTANVAKHISDDFHHAGTRHLLLDYDGTLVPFARHPWQARPDENLLKLLGELSANTQTDITIISGRDSSTLEEWFSNLSLNLVAEHGASIRLKNGAWTHGDAIDQTWKPLIRPTLELFAQRSPGAFIEEKNHTLAWHYRNVDAELGFVRSRELLDNLFHLVRNGQLQIIDGNKVIEVRVAGVDKGNAARRLVDDHAYDFVLAIGDDKTDEDMFRALTEKAVTIKVGAGHTLAHYNIPSQQGVIQLLNQLAH
jgi:trehalose 6-phosphate synthase/phosphatase